MLKTEWFLVDAEGKKPGRLASALASFIQKEQLKKKKGITAKVVVINLSRLFVEAKRLKKKFFFSHSGYPGGLTKRSYFELFRESPEKFFRRILKGMLAKNCVSRRIIANDVYLHLGKERVPNNSFSILNF